jgi:hypothetical protein
MQLSGNKKIHSPKYEQICVFVLREMAFLFLSLYKLLICTVVGINDKGFALVRVPRNDVDKICDERGHLALEHPRVAPDHVLFVHVGVILLLHHCGPQVFILSTNISRQDFFSCEKIAFCLLSSPQAMFASLSLFITWRWNSSGDLITIGLISPLKTPLRRILLKCAYIKSFNFIYALALRAFKRHFFYQASNRKPIYLIYFAAWVF